MSRPVFYVDFNEMVDSNTVLLSVEDTRADASGVIVHLQQGMYVTVYMDDLVEDGNVDNLVANGVVVRNTDRGWAAHVKWCCRIDSDGIRAQSEIGGWSECSQEQEAGCFDCCHLQRSLFPRQCESAK